MRLTASEAMAADHAITYLFRDLRVKHKAIARKWFTCCQSCAGYEVASNEANHGRPFVYLHQQDRSRLLRDHESRVYVKYGWVTNTRLRDAGHPVRQDDEVIGRWVKEVAESLGITVEWTGQARDTVILDFKPGVH